MFDEKVLYPTQFPVEERNRKSTDVCCTIIGAIFALTMFIVACTMWNKDNFEKTFFQANSGNKALTCPDNQFLYWSNPNNAASVTCVNNCPAGTDQSNRFCLPQDDKLRETVLNIPGVGDNIDYGGFKTTLIWSSLAALGLGLLWMTISFCFPKLAPIIAHIMGALVLITLGILILVLPDNFWKNNLGITIPVAVIFFLIAIILIAMLCWWANQRKFQGLMLDYGKRFLSERPLSFFYIPLFILFAIGLVALFIWQHSCFSTVFHGDDQNFFNFNNTGVWEVLNILELYWGLRFLRDAFNFCVSGNAVDWYWFRPNKTSCYAPYQRLLCKHWGSVVGGSFLGAFFQIPTLIMQLFICHPQACCAGLGRTCYNSCSWLTCLFDLVRTDAYSYINLSGIPFCNAARQCKKINERNPSFIGSHSPMYHYKFAANTFLISAALLMSWFILRARVIQPTFWHWLTLAFVLYAIVQWFANILGDAAEGLQTSFLAERQLENGNYKFMQRLLPSYRTPLEHLERRLHGEGDGFC